MKTYTVKITEANVCFVQVQAPAAKDAEILVQEMYESDGTYMGEHISMDEGGVEFEAVYESEE